MKIWDVVKNITKNKQPIPFGEIEKIYKPFLVNRVLMRDKTLVSLVNMFNTNDIPDELQYEILMTHVKQSNRYLPFPAVMKEEKTINILIRHFFVKRDVALFYLSLLKPEELEVIVNEFEELEKSNGPH